MDFIKSNDPGIKQDLLPKESQEKRKGKTLFIVLLILVTLGVVVLGFWYQREKVTLDKKAIYAVFLTNGQVYFGQIKKITSNTLELKKVYYLQMEKPLQEQKEKKAEETKFSLVKLGSELHGPEDLMMVNRDHILFTEKLKEDSKVVKAIREHEKK